MSELFTFNKDPGMTLFKGVPIDTTFDSSYDKPVWFTEEMQVALNYGGDDSSNQTKIFKFMTNKPLKLININSWIFRMSYMDKLNEYFDSKGINDQQMQYEKHLSSLSLGLPNDSINNVLMRTYDFIPKNVNHNQTALNNIIVKNGFQLGHRYSEMTLDAKMVEMIKQFYGNEFDGYISPFRVKSKWMDKDFAPEICLFNVSDAVKIIDENIYSVDRTNRKMKGGSNSLEVRDPERYQQYLKMNYEYLITDEERRDQHNKSTLAFMRRFEYTDDEIKYDKRGFIISPTLHEAHNHHRPSFHTFTQEGLNEMGITSVTLVSTKQHTGGRKPRAKKKSEKTKKTQM